MERIGLALGARLRLDRIGTTGSYWTGAGVSSAVHTWTTPPDFLARLYPLVDGRFDLDPCSSEPGSSVRARIRFTAADDGLALSWSGSVFMNPPYGRALAQWVRKAREEAGSGRARPVMGLVPARPDTCWWHQDVAGHADVFALRGRLRFGAGKTPAPFPSALIIWGTDGALRTNLRQALPEAWYIPPQADATGVAAFLRSE